MIQIFKKDFYISVTFVFFILYSLFWLYIQTTPTDGFLHNFFSDTFPIVTLWGGISGLIIAKKWGGFKSLVGKAISMFALSFLSITFCEFTYTFYYIYYGIDMAYPNIGDLGYLASIFFYIYGIILISQVCGIQFKLKNKINLLLSVFLLLVLLFLPYQHFLKGYVFDWSNPYRIILDLGIPIGGAVYLSIALITYLLSRSTLGGVMKNKILTILMALIFQYIADYIYAYQQAYENFSFLGIQFGEWSSGGLTEYLYFLSYTVVILSILQFNLALKELQINKQ